MRIFFQPFSNIFHENIVQKVDCQVKYNKRMLEISIKWIKKLFVEKKYHSTWEKTATCNTGISGWTFSVAQQHKDFILFSFWRPCIKNSDSEFRTQTVAKPANSIFIKDFRRPLSRLRFHTQPFDVTLPIQLLCPAFCKRSKPLSYLYSINYPSRRHNSANRTKASFPPWSSQGLANSAVSSQPD